MKRIIISVAMGFLVGLTAAPVASAQTPLQWELVGTEESPVSENRIEGIAFRKGGDPDGSIDTLYAVSIGGGVFRFSPSAEEWELLCNVCATHYMTATKEGYLLIGSEAGPHSDGSRSTDGGRTWEYDVIGVSVTELFQSTLPSLGGAVYACNGAYCARSFEGGAAGSWIAGELMGGQPDALAEVLPSEALPEGRLLGGAWNGVAYSDDGGQTWTPSALWQPGRFVVASLTFAPDPAHPYGGIAFAGVRDFGLGRPAVYRSDDAGQTWEQVLAVELGDYGLEGPDWIVVQASPGPGGAIFAGVEDAIPGTDPSLGTVLASADGGETWTQVADSTNGWVGWGVRVFEVGRDGRLYVGTDRGVWRTVEAVFPVSAEGGSEVPGKPDAELAVYPNPTSASAIVALTLDATSEVKVSVVDVLGRRVASLAEGHFETGAHRLVFDASTLPAGAYIVRAAVGSSRALSRRLTVLR